jgi:hypothetical protein
MEIRLVNGFMAKALETEKKKGNHVLAEIAPEKYNGVDVKRVGTDRKGLISYLAKYISKNEIEFYRLPWHCSRDVSRLFTSVNFEEDQVNDFIHEDLDKDERSGKLPDKVEKYKMYYAERVNVGGFRFTPPKEIYIDLDETNELLYIK